MNKKSIIADIRKVASELNRTPTRDEYCGKGSNKKRGKFSEHAIRKFFEGSFDNAIRESGLQPYQNPSVTTEPGYKIAVQSEHIKALQRELEDLKGEVVSAKRIKQLIGSIDGDITGEGAKDWLNGTKGSRGKINGIPTLFLSDLHLDEVVKPEQVNHVNHYNREIAEKRLAFTFKEAVNLLKNYLVNPSYEGIIVPFGGDFLSGNIHDELTETNEDAINKTILFWADRMVAGLTYLADEFGKVFVPCVVGNHGRHHKKPRAKNSVIDNYEWLMYHIIARSLSRDTRISFKIEEAPDCFYEVYGRRVCLTHGDQFRGGEGVGGIMVPIRRGAGKKQAREAALQRSFDLIIMGHWHQHIHQNDMIINGSMKGYDEYAFKSNFGFEPPKQAIWIHHRDRGVIFPMSVICDGYEEKKANLAKGLSW